MDGPGTEIWRSAQRVRAQHGKRARRVATETEATLWSVGDHAGAQAWQSIARALEWLESHHPPGMTAQ